jgi:hypothetical protein
MPHGAWEVIVEFAVILLCPLIHPLYLRSRGLSRADAWRGFTGFAVLYALIALIALFGWLGRQP